MSTSANPDQIRYWNEDAGRAWVDEQQHMDVMLAPFADLLYATAAVVPGDRVVDIGCGCGTTTLALADAAAPGGSAWGVDVSQPMIEHARNRATASQHTNASFVIADAQTAAAPIDGFDVVASRFGVMFFDDPTAAFANMRGWCRRGARLAFVCWGPVPDNTWASGIAAAVASVLPPAAPPDPTAPGPFAFADASRVRAILDDSGWTAVDIVGVERPVRQYVGLTVEQATDRAMHMGVGARLLSGADDATRAAARTSVHDFLARNLSGDGFVSPGAVWLVTARNP